MTNFLTIDTSAQVVVGICAERLGEVSELAVARSADTRHHVEVLTPLVKTVLEQADIAKPDAIIAGTGPAPFTGLRAGLVTARTLAAAWDVPIYGLSSAEVLALAGAKAGGNIVESIIDARRKEVYALRARALGADDIEVLQEVRVISPQLLAGELEKDPALVVCAEADLYVDELPGERIVAACTPVVMVRLLRSRQARSEAGENITFSLQPQYLRRPDVQGGKAQPHSAGNPYELNN